MSGKGSAPRPFAVNQDTFADNWSRTFGAKAEASSNKVEAENGNGREPDPQGQGQAEGFAEQAG